MGKTSQFSSNFHPFYPFSSVWGENLDFLTLFRCRWRKIALFALAGAVLLTATGCWQITGVLVRAKCSHDDFVIKHCVVYPKFTREKRG